MTMMKALPLEKTKHILITMTMHGKSQSFHISVEQQTDLINKKINNFKIRTLEKGNWFIVKKEIRYDF